MARASLRAHWIIIGCCAAILGACTAARDEEILPGPALEPLALPVPELPPVDPSSLLTRHEAVSAVHVDISERGLISITPIAAPSRESLCDATPSAELSAPFASSFGTLPFDSWLEIGPEDVRLGITNADDPVISDTTYGGLDWRLGLATHSSLGLALGDEESDMGAGFELPLSVGVDGHSIRTAMLQSAWSSAQGGQVSPAPQAV